MKKNLALLQFCDGEYIFAVSVCIDSFRSKYDGEFDIHIIFDDITKKYNKNDLSVIVDIHKNITIHFLSKGIPGFESLDKNLFNAIDDKYPLVMYSKYYALCLLEEYKKVFYCDSDVLFLKNISSLISMSGSGIYGRNVFNKKLALNRLKQWFSVCLEENFLCIPNAGLLLFNDSIVNRSEVYKTIIKNLNIVFLHGSKNDEPALHAAIHYHSIPYHNIPEEYHAGMTSRLPQKPFCIHCFGKNKIWNNKLLQLVYSEWGFFYKKWVSLGGGESKICNSPYDNYFLEFERPAQLIMQLIYINFWIGIIPLIVKIMPVNFRLTSSICDEYLYFLDDHESITIFLGYRSDNPLLSHNSSILYGIIANRDFLENLDKEFYKDIIRSFTIEDVSVSGKIKIMNICNKENIESKLPIFIEQMMVLLKGKKTM